MEKLSIYEIEELQTTIARTPNWRDDEVLVALHSKLERMRHEAGAELVRH